MNLHSIVAPIIAAVNPMLTVQIQRSTGYTIGADGLGTPQYAAILPVQGQVQALTAKELAQANGIQQQGEKLAIYVNGDLLGEVRPDSVGGDILTLPDGSTWLVLQVLENWDRSAGWTKAAIVRQNDTSITVPLDNH